MIRNLKVLGLTLVAISAMASMVAAAARAEKAGEFWATTSTVAFDTTADSAHQKFVAAGRTVTCTGVSGHSAYIGISAEQTVTGVGYSNCHTTLLGLSFPTTITSEGPCHYTFTAGTHTLLAEEGAGVSHGSVHICGSTINIYTNAASHAAGTIRCQIHVPAQTISNVTLYNRIGPNKRMAVTVDFNEASILNTTVTDFNTLGCDAHETITSKYTGSAWVEGTTSTGGATDTTLTGT